jgi:Phospholipase_D-nuclease N-terminal
MSCSTTPQRIDLLAAFPLNWLETTILLVAWAALIVDVMRQQWISRAAKIAWIVFIILVPIVSWIAYGIVRHRRGVGAGR